jgi:hypothetical protein
MVDTTELEIPKTQLRVYLLIRDLQRQFAAQLGTPLRARGYPAYEGSHALIIEVAPALAIQRITDLAIGAVPDIEPGILYVERHFGVLQLHSSNLDHVMRAGAAVLDGIQAHAEDQHQPQILYADVIEGVSDQQAVIINRSRTGSMLLPGSSLLVYEVVPALFAAVAANEAERAVPGVTLVDVQIIGAAGRIYLSGTTEEVVQARDEITAVLRAIEGTEQVETR